MAKTNTPRISVNKLGEYMMSKAARQRQILRDQKFPTDFKGMYYKEAAEAVSFSLASNLEDLSALHRTLRLLEQMNPDKIGTQRRISSNIDAIESFETMLDSIDFKSGTPEMADSFPQKLIMQNVEISVRPEIILRGTGKSDKKLLGAVKIHFSRTFPLNDVSAGYVSAVVQEYCRTNLSEDGEVYGPYCFVLDIGSRKIYPGVKATTTRLRDVQAECQNIAALWQSIGSNE